MAYVVADRVKETSTTTGTGNFTLAGAATGFRTFSSTVGTGNTTTYVITNSTGSEWEVGLGTLSGSTTLVRTQVFSSSNSGSAVNFSAGTKSVFVSMSAAPANFNTILGTNTGFIPDTQSNTTVIGYGASSGGDGNTAVGYQANASGSDALAIGINSTASAFASVAVGRTSNASNTGATAVGPGAAAIAFQSTAVGNDASAGASGALALGYGANASAASSVVVGAGSSVAALSAPYDICVVVGNTSSTTGGITIGSNSPGNMKNGATIIGHGITPLEDDATYMNKFRTSVTPVGTAWTLTWDDSTNEVYAAASGPGAPNWYTYQDLGFGGSISLALPAATPTAPPSFTDNWLQAIGFWSAPTNWTGTSGYFFNSQSYTLAYGSTPFGYPLPDPTTASGTAYGVAVSYYIGTGADAGTTATYQLAYGSFPLTGFGTSVSIGTFSLNGTTQYGHAIIMLAGSYTTGFTSAGAGFSVLDTVYDAYANTTYIFMDIDAAGVSSMSSGNPMGSLSSPTSYSVLFWYNY